jgi:hypothetical protein
MTLFGCLDDAGARRAANGGLDRIRGGRFGYSLNKRRRAAAWSLSCMTWSAAGSAGGYPEGFVFGARDFGFLRGDAPSGFSTRVGLLASDSCRAVRFPF